MKYSFWYWSWIPAIKLKYISGQADQLRVDFKLSTHDELRSSKFISELDGFVCLELTSR